MLYFAWKAFLSQLVSFPLWPPLTHPTTHPRDYRGGDTKRGEGGLAGPLMENSIIIIFFFLNQPLVCIPLEQLSWKMSKNEDELTNEEY